MVRVALLSNPRSTGNIAALPRIRKFCAHRSDIFHYEVEDVGQIGDALRTISRVRPKVLVINGGDGTVQAAMTELHHGGHFGGSPPPVAVLPNGKTNLIALDLGAGGDPIAALERVIEIARTDLDRHIVSRELIALSSEATNGRAVIGMFLGGAGLADSILYCRHTIYPLGLPNGVSHFLTAIAVVLSTFIGIRGRFLPPRARPLRVSVVHQGQIDGRFSLLMVTTLERLLLIGSQREGSASAGGGRLKLMMVEQSAFALMRAVYAGLLGKLGRSKVTGVHIGRGDEIRIEGDQSNVILDGELFKGDRDWPIVLKSTQARPFVRLAA